jgi:hypothetical protein
VNWAISFIIFWKNIFYPGYHDHFFNLVHLLLLPIFISSNQTKTNLFDLIRFMTQDTYIFSCFKTCLWHLNKIFQNVFFLRLSWSLFFFFTLVHLLSLPIFLCHLIKIKLTYLTQSGLWSKLQNYLHALKCVCGTWTSFFTQNNLIT